MKKIISSDREISKNVLSNCKYCIYNDSTGTILISNLYDSCNTNTFYMNSGDAKQAYLLDVL
jgi:hypothetical protein